MKMGNRQPQYNSADVAAFPKGLPPSMGAPLAPGATVHPSLFVNFSKIAFSRYQAVGLVAYRKSRASQLMVSLFRL